jgi:hypothetical protein
LYIPEAAINPKNTATTRAILSLFCITAPHRFFHILTV